MTTYAKYDRLGWVPESCSIEDIQLELNGTSIVEAYFIDVYRISFYAMKNTHDSFFVLNNQDPIVLRFDIFSHKFFIKKIAKKIQQSLIDFSKHNATRMLKRIDQFMMIFEQELIDDHDQFHFLFLPGRGVQILKNKVQVNYIEGQDFSRAFLNIWFGKHAIDKKLKNKLLQLD